MEEPSVVMPAPPKAKERAGERYGRLVVLPEWRRSTNKCLSLVWKCRCDCGNILWISSCHLKSGNTKSCGCLSSEASRKVCEKRNGKNSPTWKGDDAKYGAIHMWMINNLGKATHCEECGLDKIPEGKKRYFGWANLDHKYRRNIKDYKQMCAQCHSDYDIKNNGKYAKNVS